MAIIKADNISIRYVTGDLKDIGLKEYVLKKIKGEYAIREFWADRHISFELERGDMLGILGTNGAGKSTLLKAISGIMIPTEGNIEINGTVAALLELGSGFDGDLTVRENTFLRGAMLGYTRKFMDEKYDEIIEFAELEEFQERPFKQLSSGMKSRLAFSIACLVNPDILILDEVLSVGDGSFKEKSANRMKCILSQGVTGILVSHSIDQVQTMCNKILWLDHGRQVVFTDKVDLFCSIYKRFLKTKKFQMQENIVNEWKCEHRLELYAGEEIEEMILLEEIEKIRCVQEKQGKKIEELSKKINSLGGNYNQEEIDRLKKTIKNNKDKEKMIWSSILAEDTDKYAWLIDKDFNDGIQEVGYRYIKKIINILEEQRPKRILELGLTMSSKAIAQYANAHEDIEYVVLEVNFDRIKDWKKKYPYLSSVKIYHSGVEMKSYRGYEVRCFSDFEAIVNGMQFDFISVKAPLGSDMNGFSRIDVLNKIPKILSKNCCIIFGDCDRIGEKNMIVEVEKTLKNNNLSFEAKKFYGDKEFMILNLR